MPCPQGSPGRPGARSWLALPASPGDTSHGYQPCGLNMSFGAASRLCSKAAAAMQSPLSAVALALCSQLEVYRIVLLGGPWHGVCTAQYIDTQTSL